jgi:hypothetical protein
MQEVSRTGTLRVGDRREICRALTIHAMHGGVNASKVANQRREVAYLIFHCLSGGCEL